MQVLLVDDHAMFRQGLTFLLDDLDSNLTYLEAGSCEQALEFLAHEQVSLILLDMKLPGKQSLEALDTIIKASPGVPIVILSGDDNPKLVRQAIRAGAAGFVPKSSSADVLVAALQLTLSGGVFLPPAALQSPAEHSTNPPTELLSPRQTAVLLQAIQGQPNKIIASKLGIAEGTVKAHLSAAYRLLGVNNRTEAVFAAARLGLTTPLAEIT